MLATEGDDRVESGEMGRPAMTALLESMPWSEAFTDFSRRSLVSFSATFPRSLLLLFVVEVSAVAFGGADVLCSSLDASLSKTPGQECDDE